MARVTTRAERHWRGRREGGGRERGRGREREIEPVFPSRGKRPRGIVHAGVHTNK